MLRCVKSESAFSLIELMIALGIIGILATLAIPRFLVYRMRAQQAEVKANLEALKIAEVTYYSENHGYTDDLSALAWRPEGRPKYLYGFSSDAGSAKNDTAKLAASGTNVGYSTVNMTLFSGVPLTAAQFPSGCDVTASGFQAAAVANIDEDPTVDQWTIDTQARLTLITDDSNS